MFVLDALDYQVLYMQQVEINNMKDEHIKELTEKLELCKLFNSDDDETGKTTGLPPPTVPAVVKSTGAMKL